MLQVASLRFDCAAPVLELDQSKLWIIEYSASVRQEEIEMLLSLALEALTQFLTERYQFLVEWGFYKGM